jgi:hypothetical protein
MKFLKNTIEEIVVQSSNRGGQPFEQVGQISSIKDLAGQKSAQNKFGGPKRNMQIEKSHILY